MTDEQKEIVEFMKNTVITLSEYDTKEEFEQAGETFYEFMKRGFGEPEIETGFIQVRFEEDGDHHPIQLNHLIVHMFMWQAIVDVDGVHALNKDHFINTPDISSKMIKTFLDEKVIKPYRKSVSNKKLNKVTHDVNYRLGRISKDFNLLMGLSIDIEQSFLFPSIRDERFDQILRTKIDQDAQINDNENMLEDLTNEMLNMIKNDPENLISPIVRSGTGIKAGQFKEFAVNGGYKPDLNGNTIPSPVNSNLIVDGLNSTTNIYVDSMGGLKAAVANSTEMGKSGHIARLIILLASVVRLGNEDDCGTRFGVKYKVETRAHLKKFVGRNYRLMNGREYNVITGEENDLIGKEIYVRSPITCLGGHDGYTLCKTCYGELHHVNSDLYSVGAYGATKNAEPVSQSILSTKHLLSTDSYRISFSNPIFNEIMEVCSNEIEVRNGDDVDNYNLIIKQEDIHKVDDYADDLEDYNEYVNKFYVENMMTGEVVEMQEDGGIKMFITPELLPEMASKMKKGVFKMPLYEVKNIGCVFTVQIENEELTKPLYAIIDLLDKDNYRKEEGIETVDQLAQHMLDLVVVSKINADSVHSEIILRELLRSKEDVLKRPDFREYTGMNDVDILTLKKALSKHPSITVSLSFQELKRQFRNLLTYEKTGSSFLDPFFKEYIE